MNRVERVLLAMAVLACARTAPATEVDAKQVESAVCDALVGMQAEGELIPGSVRFPTTPVKEPGAEVAAESVTISDSGHLSARMRCRPRDACLPFYASAQLQGGAGRARRWSVPDTSRPRSVRVKSLKPGDAVTFVRDRDGIRTRVLAVALEAGAIGDIVRVRAVDGKREVLHGRLCTEHVVRGE